MLIKQIMEVFDVLDSSTVDGAAVKKYCLLYTSVVVKELQAQIAVPSYLIGELGAPVRVGRCV